MIRDSRCVRLWAEARDSLILSIGLDRDKRMRLMRLLRLVDAGR